MNERVDKLMQAAGLKENVLNTLERGDSMFVLTDQTLLFQDGGGTRRVTLRDLKRIHSDQDGLLRVETPAGTALTANLVGFDPAAVQSFFAQVRDATARAKQRAGTMTITPETAPATSMAATSAAATSAVVAGAASAAPVAPQRSETRRPDAQADATWTGTDRSASSPAVNPGTARPQEQQPASIPATPPARTVIAPAASPVVSTPSTGAPEGGLGLTSKPSTFTPPPPPPAFKPQEPQATVKPMVRAVRNPTVITDPSVLSGSEVTPVVVKPTGETPDLSPRAAEPVVTESVLPEPVESVPVTSRVNGSAASSLASLAAVAGGVSGWIGALKAMSLIMLLATFGMAYFLYDKGQGINGFWTLIAGGMGAVALWVLSDVVKLLVSMAQAVSAEGGVMDVD